MDVIKLLQCCVCPCLGSYLVFSAKGHQLQHLSANKINQNFVIFTSLHISPVWVARIAYIDLSLDIWDVCTGWKLQGKAENVVCRK